MQSLPANPLQRKRTDAEKHLFFPSRSPAEQPEKARVGHAQHKEQNRVMVMCDGRITGFIDGKDATQENIMALATQFETAPTAAANQ